MVESGVTPFIWTGKYLDYTCDVTTAFYADYEGYDNFILNYSFNGMADNIVTSIDNGRVTVESLQITPENGYKVFSQAGRYFALDFMKRLVSNSSYYGTLSFSGSETHYDAQNDFLYGNYSSRKTTYAMLMEGSWWQNQANDTFESMENTYGPSASRQNRKIGFLPLPKATNEKIGSERTLTLNKDTLCMINGNCNEVQMAVAKKFLQFCHTDVSLANFNRIVGMPKPYQYTLTQEQYDSMSLFAQQLYDAHSTCRVVYPQSQNPLYLSAPSIFVSINTWNSQTSSGAYGIPVSRKKQKICFTIFY